jgi:threonine dehydrogenase-like Zn-dependent dehydrogenase
MPYRQMSGSLFLDGSTVWMAQRRREGRYRTIRVDAIKFNHDPSSAANDALNLRRNASQWVNVPEWRRGISVMPEDSEPEVGALAEGFHAAIVLRLRRATDRSDKV